MNKRFSILSLLFGLLVSAALFTACGGDDDEKDSPSNPLVGTWRAEVMSKESCSIGILRLLAIISLHARKHMLILVK